jgi:hypothetical protein
MNRKHVISLTIAGAVFAGILAIVLTQLATPVSLTLYLRCSDSKLGVLTVAQGTHTGTFRDMAQIDLSVACNEGKVEIAGYQPENRLYFKLSGVSAKQSEAVAEYGRDIQSDEDGFYAVLKVSGTPPYLTNDQI